MPSAPDLFEMMIAVLSVPAVAAAIAWLARRFSKESRLLIRLERLAAIYPNLPDGPIRVEFPNRVADTGAELNARLDPLFTHAWTHSSGRSDDGSERSSRGWSLRQHFWSWSSQDTRRSVKEEATP